ncbi:amidase [Pelagibius litoralis]|uniref:Amidase n=1 Tax=Pelagibius litoralis TaxID=374515 RepID=A0A967EV04_9PROT|nr:amidase [Pelagibius litoralis]NIA67114.1 amidase [Pelagibius litoralis]
MTAQPEAGIAELRRDIDSGETTAVEVTAQYLARIDRMDARVNAVMEINPEATAIAQALDKERVAGKPVGPLHGIPVMIKDNIDTADRMMTTAGSIALEGNRAQKDAAVAARLRAAGAVILGKTNLSEWANFRSSRSSSGWSSRGGQTRNPYALDRSPGGSSSGSAVAVAANFCTVAVGTETDGSIVSPAAMNGVVGIKPTVGLVSRSGIIPVSHSQDTAGPMARSVADAALVLGALAGSDPEDPATVDADCCRAEDYTSYLDKGGLRDARIGAIPDLAGMHEGIAKVFAHNLTAIREAGAQVVDGICVTTPEVVRAQELQVMTSEFKACLNRYLAALPPGPGPHNLEALIAFNEENRARVMPYYPQDLFEKSQATAGLEDPAYQSARETCLRLIRTESIDKAMNEHQLDALVVPTTCAPWLIDWVNGDNRFGSSAYLAAISGYPSITVPAGYLFGLPVGLSFIARAYQEPALIRFAYAFEQATQIRVPPGFAETAKL